LRLSPALIVAVALDLVLRDDNRSMAWANVLYVSNLIPVAKAAMGWTWSLSIEEQFYLLCPWFLAAIFPLSAGRRFLAVAFVGPRVVIATAYIVVRFDLRPADAEVVVNVDYAHWCRAFDLLYDKLWTRAGALLAGVGAAVLYRSPGAIEAVGRR